MDPMEQLQKQVSEIAAGLQANFARQSEEMKAFGKASEESVAGQRALEKRLDDIEKRLNRPDFEGDARKTAKSLGRAFCESKAFKAMKSAGSRYSEPFEVKEEAVTVGESGALATPYRDPDVVMPNARVLTLRNFVNSVNVSGPVTYFKQSARYVLYTELAAQASLGQATATVKRSRGIKVGSTMTIGTGGAAESKTVGSINHTTKVVTFTSNLAGTHAADTQLTADTFDYSPEAKIRPAGKVVFTQESCALKTLARHIPVTEEMLEDAPQIESVINVDLTRSLDEEEETQMFHGDGTGEQLTGIFNNTECLTYLQSSGKAGDTKLDALRRAITLLLRRGYRPSAIFISPEDKEEIDLLKGDDGHYINVAMILGSGTSQVMQVPLVASAALNANEAAVGDWLMAVTVYNRRETTVRIVEPEDYSLRGLRAVMGSKRKGFAIRRPDGIVKVSFDGPPV
jgi:hypothetical protein